MDKCYLHHNTCAGAWELYIGQKQPVCGMGGYVKDEQGDCLQWVNADDALRYAENHLGYKEISVSARTLLGHIK